MSFSLDFSLLPMNARHPLQQSAKVDNSYRPTSMPSRIQERKRGRESSSSTRLCSAIAVVALMLSHGLTPSDCFLSASTASDRRSPTRRYFQNSIDRAGNVVGVHRSYDARINFLSRTMLTQEVPILIPATPSDWRTPAAQQIQTMPIWLKQSESNLYEEKWNSLRVAMKDSFFTDSEILKLKSAIMQASSGARHKMTGAVEFCLIMVETMEMGLNSLIAGVFHYCYCVTARERSLLLPPKLVSSAWDVVDFDHSGLAEFGKHAVLIAKDAASLKNLEMVAGTVIQNSDKPRRVTPNSEDAENLKNLLLTEMKDWRALAIRSAAALYRLRGIIKNAALELTPESALVAREALYIYAPLASRLGMHRLKNELEGAAFRILYRRQYEKVNKLAREARGHVGRHSNPALIEVPGCPLTSVDIAESMKHILAEVKEEMTEMLKKDGVFSSVVSNFSVSARVKEPYSMWKKMQRNGTKHIIDVPDAVALRIILEAKKLSPDEPDEITRARDKALCYYAQSLCQQRWKPCGDESRFKDYIGKPKRNGYQSLHYTAITRWGGEDWSMEIQTRSGEMHQVAEFGLASHWNYKAQQNRNKSSKQSMANPYLFPLQEWHWKQNIGATVENAVPSISSDSKNTFSEHAQDKVRADRIRERAQRLEPYIEALKATRSHLTRENVFVFISQTADFLPEGKVLSLPAGACVLDALREVERQLDISLQSNVLVSCNGSAAAETAKLHNGDILQLDNSGGVFQ